MRGKLVRLEAVRGLVSFSVVLSHFIWTFYPALKGGPGDLAGYPIWAKLLALSPRLHVLLISGAGRISPNAAKAAGASGFISKDWPAADIAGAVRMVGLGMTVFKPHEAPAGPPLSEREREVLEAIASGATNREIAGTLYLSPHTVKEHTSSLYRKLGVRNRAEAVQKAQRLGLIS